jgi:hypothetical protein
MWLIARNLYLKFQENTLRNKELIVKKRKKLESEILKFSLFVAIATRIFNMGRTEKDVHNLQTATNPYFKFHKNIFSTFSVITGSRLCVKFAIFSVYLLP